MPADVVTQVLNFGVSSMIDVQIESKDPAAAFAIARALAPKIRKIPGRRGRAHRAGDQPPGAAARCGPPAGAAAQHRLPRRRGEPAHLAELVVADQPELLGQPQDRRELHRCGADADRAHGQRRRSAGYADRAGGRAHAGEHDRQRPEPDAGAARRGHQRAQHDARHGALPGRHRAALAHAGSRVDQPLHRAADHRRAGVGVGPRSRRRVERRAGHRRRGEAAAGRAHPHPRPGAEHAHVVRELRPGPGDRAGAGLPAAGGAVPVGARPAGDHGGGPGRVRRHRLDAGGHRRRR